MQTLSDGWHVLPVLYSAENIHMSLSIARLKYCASHGSSSSSNSSSALSITVSNIHNNALKFLKYHRWWFRKVYWSHLTYSAGKIRVRPPFVATKLAATSPSATSFHASTTSAVTLASNRRCCANSSSPIHNNGHDFLHFCQLLSFFNMHIKLSDFTWLHLIPRGIPEILLTRCEVLLEMPQQVFCGWWLVI